MREEGRLLMNKKGLRMTFACHSVLVFEIMPPSTVGLRSEETFPRCELCLRAKGRL